MEFCSVSFLWKLQFYGVYGDFWRMTRDKENITEKKVKFWKGCTIFLVYLWKVTLRFKELSPNKIRSHSVEKLLASNSSDGPRAANKFPKDFDSYARYVIWMLVSERGFNETYREEREAKFTRSFGADLQRRSSNDTVTIRLRSRWKCYRTFRSANAAACLKSIGWYFNGL